MPETTTAPDQHDDYLRMARAIEWVAARAGTQPDLGQVAAAAGLSPHHFQKVFSRWVGVSPKRYLQVLTVERAKSLLAGGLPVMTVADEVGLSSGSRLHDHFVALEAATPGEFGAGGRDLQIHYGIAASPFGTVFTATTPRGVCRLEFLDGAGESAPANPVAPLDAVCRDWPHAALVRDDRVAGTTVARIFGAGANVDRPLSLHVRGTNFQVAVWRALLAIPPGEVTSYAGLAASIGKPSAARAVGAAVGANPVAFAIPCHRVIRGSGELGGYRWGLTRKLAMHSWETARSARTETGQEPAPQR